MDNSTDPIDAPEDWIAALVESEAAFDRGEAVPLEPVLERMRASSARATRAAHHRRTAG